MIFFLYGADTYRSRQKLNELKAKFLKEVDKAGINLAEMDGAKIKLNDFNAAISTPPFLARKRFLAVENLLSNKNKELLSGVAELLNNKKEILEQLIVVFWEGEKVDQRTALFKYLSKPQRGPFGEKYAQEFTVLKDEEIKSWLRIEIKKRGGNFTPSAVGRLAELVGGDLWQASGEIDKLISYKAGKMIDIDDVDLLVRGKFDDNIFHFVDAIAHKNKKLAYKLLSDQINSGAEELYLLAMLIRQFRILLQVGDVLEAGGVNQYQLAKELGLHPFVAQKALAQAHLFSADKLRKIYQELLQTDFKLKTSGGDKRLLFDLLLAKIMN